MTSAGSDNSVYINILNRLIGLFGNLGVIVVILFTLDSQMQGFYYTFYSLVFLKFFAELGLSFAVVQIISHIASSPKRAAELKPHIWFFIKWFGIAAILLSAALLPAILLFEEQYTPIENHDLRVVAPWLILSIATGFGVFLNGMVSIIEGHKKILDVSKIRLKQAAANISVVVTGLFLGAELWSLALGAVAGIIAASWGIFQFRSFFKIDPASRKQSIEWMKEIWPFQWRLGISWISGFFIFYFLTPIALKFDGPEAAGRLGMSLQLFQAMNSLGILFVSTHSAVFGGLIAQSKINQMELAFISSVRKSTLFLIVLLGGFWTVKLISDQLLPELVSDRFLTNIQLGIVTVACICNHVFFVMNYFFRCFKVEALWFLSLINSVSTIILALIFVPRGGVLAATIIYAANAFVFWILIATPYCLKWRRSIVRPSPASTTAF